MSTFSHVLGLDLGTNSIGWAIRNLGVREQGEEAALKAIERAGVLVFTTPMHEEKGRESGSLASQRTLKRSMRKRIQRRRKRKQELLMALAERGMVPLDKSLVERWMKKKADYPVEQAAFVQWLKMDFDGDGKPDFLSPYEVSDTVKQILGPNWAQTLANPYLLRALAIEKPELISDEMLGRIAYHFIQRRGYLSNRKETASNEKTGDGTQEEAVKPGKVKKAKEDDESAKKAEDNKKVLSAIKDYEELLEQENIHPGQEIGRRLLNWVQEDGTPERARNRMGSTNKYGRLALKKEWRAIVAARGMNPDASEWKELEEIIFRNRPLKSQKQNIGRCTLEPTKFRMPISHPVYEYFRVWQVVNNIKYGWTNSEVETETATGRKVKKEIKSTPEVSVPCTELLTLEQKNKLVELFIGHKTNLSETAPKKHVAEVLGCKPKDIAINYPSSSTIAGSPFLCTCREVLGVERMEQMYQLALDRLHTEEQQTEQDWSKNGALAQTWAELKLQGPDLFQLWQWLFEAESDDDYQDLLSILEKKLGIGDEAKVKQLWNSIKDGYSMLSMRASLNILRFMEEGYRYDEAALLAKLPKLFGYARWQKDGAALLSTLDANLSTTANENLAKKLANNWLADYNKNVDTESENHKPSRLEPSNLTDIDILKIKNLGQYILKELAPEDAEAALNRALELVMARVHLGTRHQKYGERPLPQQSLHTFGLYEMENHLETTVQFVLAHTEGLSDTKVRKALYHHSQVEHNFKNLKNQGPDELPSPITNSLRNPVVLRALNQLRRLVNHLIKTKQLDPSSTIVQLEMARELNTANMRKAILKVQKDDEAKREAARKDIRALMGKDYQVSETEIKKYLLWEDQGKRCLYTDASISLTALLDSGQYDIEHTIPQSRYPDSELENMSICDATFNRQTKRARFAADLPAFEEIEKRLKVFEEKKESWKKKLEAARKSAKGASTKDAKDAAIVKAHEASIYLDFYSSKLKCFRTKEAEFKGGFRKRQLRDTMTINKYAVKFLEQRFERVKGSKGSVTSLIRKAWELNHEDEKKVRTQHYHHAEDAILQTLLYQHGGEKGAYRLVSELKHGNGVLYDRYKKDLESEGTGALIEDKLLKLLRKAELVPYGLGKGKVRQVIQEKVSQIIVAHAPVSSPLKQTKRLRRDKQGRPVKTANGEHQYVVGTGIRTKLHKETFYGRIKLKTETGYETVYRETLAVSSLSDADIERIVDLRIRALAREKGSAGCERDGYLEIPVSAKSLLVNASAKPQKVYKVKVISGEKAPLGLKAHTNPLGAKPSAEGAEKRMLYAKNDSNFLLKQAPDKKGVVYRPANALEVVKMQDLKPELLVLGTQVVFYENHPDEINWENAKELQSRIYTLKIIEGSGQLTFRQSTFGQDTPEMGRGLSSYTNESKPAKLRVSRPGWTFLVIDGINVKQMPDGSLVKP